VGRLGLLFHLSQPYTWWLRGRNTGMTGREYVYLSIAGFLWGSGHPVIRYILSYNSVSINSLHIAFLSTVVGLTVLLFTSLAGGTWHGFTRLGWRGLAVAGVSGTLQNGLYPILSYSALSYIPASLNAMIVGSSPILIAALSILLLGERLRLVGYAGICLALAGLVVLVGGYGGGSLSPTGVLLSFLASLTAAVYAIAGRYLMRNHDPISVSIIGAGLGSILLANVTYSLSGFNPLFASEPLDLALIAYWGMALAVGNLLFYISLRKLDAVRSGSFFFVSPVAAAVLSIIFLGEPLTVNFVAGVGLALAGVRLAQSGMLNR
jgi:probable blue pigment (indigoidine) exporter